LGQGLTLNEANRLVLVEPGWHASVEARIADRVHRIGMDRSMLVLPAYQPCIYTGKTVD
jgi:SNF2 family DNA or RNA helicase